MQEVNPPLFNTLKLSPLSMMRRQDGLITFTEKPSDKYDLGEEPDRFNNIRMNALDLFSLFTADIIKEKVVFIR